MKDCSITNPFSLRFSSTTFVTTNNDHPVYVVYNVVIFSNSARIIEGKIKIIKQAGAEPY